MNIDLIQQNRDRLLRAMPLVSGYYDNFHTINSRWAGAITAGMIETGHMPAEAAELFIPLIQDMRTTKTNYNAIQERLVDAILFEMTSKIVLEITDAAKFAINILKRNLFERTADVGYLATDTEIVSFLQELKNIDDPHVVALKREDISRRLADYQYEYTVYDEIIILDTRGQVHANFDATNRVASANDPLLKKTQAIDLYQRLSEDKYVETYRETDLRPVNRKSLIYSQKIVDSSRSALGTLCLFFTFEDEMKRIFGDLSKGGSRIIVAILDERGQVMSSSNDSVLPQASRISVDLESDFRFLTFNKKNYLATMVPADSYQGFIGLTWYALAMTDITEAFKIEETERKLDKEFIRKLQNFSQELSEIKMASEDLLDDMRIDSINGQVKATKFQAKAFVEVLHFVKSIGEEIDGLFNAAVQNLQETIVTGLFNEVQFRAFQGNNIADRNLYERANDVCWWALTPMFRELMLKNATEGLDDSDRQMLTDNLQYINNLYTPYLRLVLANAEGVVIAASNPPEGLQEVIIEEGLPAGQDIVGMELPKDFVHKAMRLKTSRDYCVSEFQPTPLYGGRATYIYSTAVRAPQDSRRTVGVIQIVFDAEPQFEAMLTDILPRDEKKNVVVGAFGLFVDRKKHIISSTNPEYPIGTAIPLPDNLFHFKSGERHSTIVELEETPFTLGLQVSEGYREYKRDDGYKNEIICMIFVPI